MLVLQLNRRALTESTTRSEDNLPQDVSAGMESDGSNSSAEKNDRKERKAVVPLTGSKAVSCLGMVYATLMLLYSIRPKTEEDFCPNCKDWNTFTEDIRNDMPIRVPFS